MTSPSSSAATLRLAAQQSAAARDDCQASRVNPRVGVWRPACRAGMCENHGKVPPPPSGSAWGQCASMPVPSAGWD